MNFLPKSVEKYYWRGQLVDVYRILEWRSLAVFKTKKVGTIIQRFDQPATRDFGITVTSVSTDTRFI